MANPELRILRAGDADNLESFLSKHRDSSMFLRSNSRNVGLEYRPEPFHALYVGAFLDGEIIGAVAHGWNNLLQLQAPEHVESLTLYCATLSGRPVDGFLGPLEQVVRARAVLGMDTVPAKMDADESLFALDLESLIVPSALLNGTIVCRAPLADEVELLAGWRFAYELETLGATNNDETRRRAERGLKGQIAQGNARVAVFDDRPVSLSAFNAELPAIVQLGGIYTPPELRGRGYARVAVAGSLLAARERGVTRAVLFTGNPSAVRSYQAVGFRKVGDFGLVLLR